MESVRVSRGSSGDLKTSEGLFPGFPPTTMKSKSLPAVTEMWQNSDFQIGMNFSEDKSVDLP